MLVSVKSLAFIGIAAALQGVQSASHARNQKRNGMVSCSQPGSSFGTHCAFFNDNLGYSNEPFGVDTSYQCNQYNAQGKGQLKCSYHDEQSVILACNTVDGSQLQVTWSAAKSFVTSVTGDYIKWSWASEGDVQGGQGSRVTYYSDDNIYISCTGSVA